MKMRVTLALCRRGSAISFRCGESLSFCRIGIGETADHVGGVLALGPYLTDALRFLVQALTLASEESGSRIFAGSPRPKIRRALPQRSFSRSISGNPIS